MSPENQPPEPQLHLRTRSTASTETKGGRANDASIPPSHVKRSRSRRSATSETSSDEATVAFVKRILCAHQIHTAGGVEAEKGSTTSKPLDELLPPLTSSNDIDLQLYALFAIIIKDFVQSWYSKITPDHEFIDEIIHIIAHCTRGLEQRLRKVDLEALLLDDLPAVLLAHSDGKLCMDIA